MAKNVADEMRQWRHHNRCQREDKDGRGKRQADKR